MVVKNTSLLPRHLVFRDVVEVKIYQSQLLFNNHVYVAHIYVEVGCLDFKKGKKSRIKNKVRLFTIFELQG
jgi:hypothetical protein